MKLYVGNLQLRLWLSLYLLSVEPRKKTRGGSKLLRVYDAPQTLLERVAVCPQAHAAWVIELQNFRKNLNPFELAKTIGRKLEHIYKLSNRRRSRSHQEKFRCREVSKRSGETVVEKLLRGKVEKQTFPLRLEIPPKLRDFHIAATEPIPQLHFKYLDNQL